MSFYNTCNYSEKATLNSLFRNHKHSILETFITEAFKIKSN